MKKEEQLVLVVSEEDVHKRLDTFLAESAAGISRSQAQRWLEEKRIFLNGKPGNKKQLLHKGDQVLLLIPLAKPDKALPEEISLSICYEDEDLLVVNKPKGMVVHPAPGHETGTLVNALLFHCGSSLSGIGGVLRPGIVHRIDKDTSGLLMVAKNDQAHIRLSQQIQEHRFLREYAAVADGVFRNQEGKVEAAIGRSLKDRKKMAVVAGGRNATTLYKVVEQFERYALLSLRLLTGRTHQIRVHMSYLNHPLAGDTVYGKSHMSRNEAALEGQCLHAKKLGFFHPRSEKWLEFDSLLPPYFTRFLDILRKGQPL